MDLNAPSLSESQAISLVLKWKILRLFLALQSISDVVWTLNFSNSFNNAFSLFLISGLVLIRCNSGSKRLLFFLYIILCLSVYGNCSLCSLVIWYLHSFAFIFMIYRRQWNRCTSAFLILWHIFCYWSKVCEFLVSLEIKANLRIIKSMNWFVRLLD